MTSRRRATHKNWVKMNKFWVIINKKLWLRAHIQFTTHERKAANKWVFHSHSLLNLERDRNSMYTLEKSENLSMLDGSTEIIYNFSYFSLFKILCLTNTWAKNPTNSLLINIIHCNRTITVICNIFIDTYFKPSTSASYLLLY